MSDKKVYTAKNVGHQVKTKKTKSSQKKVNVILKNTIGPEESTKKVKIPIDTPISKLKARIAEVYGLDPNDFQLSHIPGNKKSGKPSQIKISKTPEDQTPVESTPTETVSKQVTNEKNTKKDNKAPVRIVLRDRTGQKKFQKSLKIPDNISIGELRDEVAKKFGMDSEEFNLSLEKYVD